MVKPFGRTVGARLGSLQRSPDPVAAVQELYSRCRAFSFEMQSYRPSLISASGDTPVAITRVGIDIVLCSVTDCTVWIAQYVYSLM